MSFKKNFLRLIAEDNNFKFEIQRLLEIDELESRIDDLERKIK